MNPPMHTRVRNYFMNAGLTDGFKVQLLMWTDSGTESDRFMVFRPNGGSNIRSGLGNEQYILVDVIGAKSGNAFVDERVQQIVDYVQQNPMTDDCVGYLQNMGAMPAPVFTTEGRLVYRLQFVATYGE
ncbi:phage tail termination protein [Cronobacter malonaticus]